MTDIIHQKASLRKSLFARRLAAHQLQLDTAANLNLADVLAGFPEPDIIAGYMAMRSEINPLEVMEGLHAQGKSLCVPIVQAAGQALRFSAWRPGVEMKAGAFGAEIPALDQALTPQILITPLLGFDRRGYRLGYGGGYYDRSFAALRAAGDIIAIGFAYSAQEVAEIPIEATDQKLDFLVTEREVLAF